MGLMDVAKGAVKTVGDVGKKATNAVVDTTKDVSKTVVNKASSAANDLYDAGKAGLTKVGDVAEKVVDKGKEVAVETGRLLDQTVVKAATRGHTVEETWNKVVHGKEDREVAERVAQASETRQPQNMGALIDDVTNIHDDQTRIESISKVYGIQQKQLEDKLGIPGATTWSGWANQAAGLVGDIHGGGKGVTSALGDVTGANKDLAHGNKKVFADIAPVTNSFIENVDGFAGKDGKFDQKKFDEWWSSQDLKESSAKDERFKQGFYNYAQAKFSDDPDEKRAWVAAGTVRMAQHEQTELQPEIENAIRGGLLGKAVNFVGGLAEKVPGHQFVPALAGPAAGKDLYNAGTGYVGTKSIPGVSTGNGQIAVDQDVKPQGDPIPSVLRNASGAARKELVNAMLDSDLLPGQTENTGASDYSNLKDRIRVLTAIMLANSDQTLPVR